MAPYPVGGGHQAPSTAHKPLPVRYSVGPSNDARQPVAPRQEKMGFRDKPEASAHAAPGSPARFETAKAPSTARPPHPSPPPQVLVAMLPRCFSSFRSSQTRNPPTNFRFHGSRFIDAGFMESVV